MCELIGVIVQKQVAMNPVVQTTHIYEKEKNVLWIIPSIRSVRMVKTAVQEIVKEMLPFNPRVWMHGNSLKLVYVQLSDGYGPYNVLTGIAEGWHRVKVHGIEYGQTYRVPDAF